MTDLVLYASGHGFGHAVRCSLLCRALLDAAPGLVIDVRTPAPAWIFPPGVTVRPRTLDVGVVQASSLDVDPGATLTRYAALVDGEAERIASEAAEVRQSGARAVLADISSAAFAIAASAGVPGLGLANFSWDWIYAPYVAEAPRHAPLLDRLREQYGQATRLFRLPFHGDLSAFPCIEDVPLIARRSTADRSETRRRFGLPLEAPLVLFSFGGHANSGPDAERLAQLPGYAFAMTGANTTFRAPASVPRDDRHGTRVDDGDAGGQRAVTRGTDKRAADHAEGAVVASRAGPNVFVLPPLGEEYVDVLAASDAVITKPGFGIVADCLANRVPVLYVSREGFREEPLLVRALETEGRAVPLARAALDCLDLGPALARLAECEQPWTTRPLDGAPQIARRILDSVG
ncbi:MAG: hypothetical protein IT305_11875 [Chloroflexi bacterium]|nr:hypothetical protein [Chloroflexota bacterium]